MSTLVYDVYEDPMTHLCHCGCTRSFPASQMHDLRVMHPVSIKCLARRRATPQVPTWGPLTVLAPMERRMGVRMR